MINVRKTDDVTVQDCGKEGWRSASMVRMSVFG